jgi:hypothetical protein
MGARHNHLGAITAGGLAAEAGLLLIGLLVQQALQRFVVIAREGLQLIQQSCFTARLNLQ